jgi:hypothetical protein
VPVNEDWEKRVVAAWATLDDYPEDRAGEFRAVIDALVAELPDGSPLGLFEQASAWDSTGHSDKAVPLYREALARGLSAESGYKGRQHQIREPDQPGVVLDEGGLGLLGVDRAGTGGWGVALGDIL